MHLLTDIPATLRLVTAYVAQGLHGGDSESAGLGLFFEEELLERVAVLRSKVLPGFAPVHTPPPTG